MKSLLSIFLFINIFVYSNYVRYSRLSSFPFIQRHRLVNEIVKEKLEGDFVHALSIETKSPAQWNESYKMDPSPNCKGGFGK